mgnify:CR=1 FL=1
MKKDEVIRIRKLIQRYAYTSLQLHEAAARSMGLSGTDHKYLGFIMQKGEMTAGELATLTGLTTGAVTGLIDRFEKKKLVKRKFAKDDRRKVIIVPDPGKIKDLLEPVYNTFQNKSENLIASFNSEEQKILETYFTKAIELMNETKDRL